MWNTAERTDDSRYFSVSPVGSFSIDGMGHHTE